MFIFSLHINAVFEGRSEQLKESAGIRNQVELAPIGGTEEKATALSPGGPPSTKKLGDTPISDAPWVMLMLGLGYGVYAFTRKAKY